MERRFTNIKQVMADLQAKAQNKQLERQKRQEELGADEQQYNCPVCKDTELIFYKVYKDDDDVHGIEMAKPCECREQNAWKRRFKQSMIPDEFINANFKNYQQTDDIQNSMYEKTQDYLKNFQVVVENDQKRKIIPSQNFGLIAVFGEQRLKELPPAERSAVKQQHNNFGIGKTHLQIALAKHLIKEGFKVLVVSDVVFIEELMQAKQMNDGGEAYNDLLNGALTADVLIWDDIGKVNWTEARERMYYTIINERYRKQKPIVFNSNEDRGTLAEKIGYAAASRLIGQAEEFLIEAEGTDYRLKKAN